MAVATLFLGPDSRDQKLTIKQSGWLNNEQRDVASIARTSISTIAPRVVKIPRGTQQP